MSLQDALSAQADSIPLLHRIAELEAEVERLRAQVETLRHDRADYQELLRREVARCSNA